MATDPRGLLLRIIALTALLVGAVVATAKAQAWWMVTIAIAALVVAAGSIGASVAQMLCADDLAPSRPARGGLAIVAGIAVAGLALSIALPTEESAGASDSRPTAGAAAQTVRDFLASAVLDDNAYAACQYLTPGAQQQTPRSRATARPAATR